MTAADAKLAKARSDASYRLDWWHGHATTKSEQRRRRDARRAHSRARRRFDRTICREQGAER